MNGPSFINVQCFFSLQRTLVVLFDQYFSCRASVTSMRCEICLRDLRDHCAVGVCRSWAVDEAAQLLSLPCSIFQFIKTPFDLPFICLSSGCLAAQVKMADQEASGENKPQPKQEGQVINLIVKDQLGSEVHFKVKSHTKLEKASGCSAWSAYWARNTAGHAGATYIRSCHDAMHGTDANYSA